MGGLDPSGILSTKYRVYRKMPNHPPRLGCEVRRKMNYELDFTQRTKQWTRGESWSSSVRVIFHQKIFSVMLLLSLKYITSPNLIIFISTTLYQVIYFYTPQENMPIHHCWNSGFSSLTVQDRRDSPWSIEVSSDDTMSHWNYQVTKKESSMICPHTVLQEHYHPK